MKSFTVHIELISGVADKPLLPPPVQRLVDTSEVVKRTPMVVVAHDVDPGFYFLFKRSWVVQGANIVFVKARLHSDVLKGKNIRLVSPDWLGI